MSRMDDNSKFHKVTGKFKGKIEIVMPFKMKCRFCFDPLIKPATLTNMLVLEDGCCISFEAILCCGTCMEKQIQKQGVDDSGGN